MNLNIKKMSMKVIETIFRITKPKSSKEKYLNAATNLDKIIKVLLMIIVIIEIIINYMDLSSGIVEVYIYNIIFPFALVYVTLFTRSYRAEKEALEKMASAIKGNRKEKVVKEYTLKSEIAMLEITKTLSDLVLSILIPYVILLFSNNQKNVLDFVVIICLFILCIYINFSNKYIWWQALLISLSFLFGILIIIFSSFLSALPSDTSFIMFLTILITFFVIYEIINKTIKS